MAKIATRSRARNPLAGIKSPQTPAGRAELERRMRETFALEMSGRPVGETLQFWLGEAARQLREEAGLGPSAVAAQLGRREATVENFEKGANMPTDLEATLIAYAKVVGLDDPRDIVRDALRLWYEKGGLPMEVTESEDADARDVPGFGPP